MMASRRVHLLEPDGCLRRRLAESLEARGYEVLAQPRPSEAMATILSHPDALVIDMAFAVDAVALVQDLRAAGYTAPVVVFARTATVPVAVMAMRAGASDFQEGALDLDRVEAILSPAQSMVRDPVHVLAQRIRLGDMQMRVLRLMAEGLSNKETGNVLHISPKTSERHRTAILRKLGLRNSTQVARLIAGLASGSIADFAAPAYEAQNERPARAAASSSSP